jgi:hypothetical protein
LLQHLDAACRLVQAIGETRISARALDQCPVGSTNQVRLPGYGQ